MLSTTRLRPRRAHKASVYFLVLAAACYAAASARAWLPLPSAGSPVAAAPPARQDGAGQDESEAEVIVLLPGGFEPTEVTRPHGRFLLVVNNRTGLEQVELRLERESGGGRLHEVRLSEGRLRSKQYEDLTPGTYLLTEADHPDWLCRITITPH